MRDLALSREKFPCDAVEQKEGTRKQSKQFVGDTVCTVVGNWVLFRHEIHGERSVRAEVKEIKFGHGGYRPFITWHSGKHRHPSSTDRMWIRSRQAPMDERPRRYHSFRAMSPSPANRRGFRRGSRLRHLRASIGSTKYTYGGIAS